MAKKDKGEKLVYGVQKQQLKNLNSKEYIALKELCKLSKNMYNVGLYNVRQHFFESNEYLNYVKNYHLSKTNENYSILNKNMAQQTLKNVGENFSSFFELLKLKKQGKYNKKVNIPNYLDKDGYFLLSFAEFNIKNNTFEVPMSPAFKKQYGKVSIFVPSNLKNHKIKEVKIIPKNDARFFEIQYTYILEKEILNLNENNSLAIDLGISNFATCVSNLGEAFIIDGKRIKSINQWSNKENARLQGIKDKQKISGITKSQFRLWNKRDNIVNDFLNKTVRYIVNYCIKNDIGRVVLGYNDDFQNQSNLGKVNNQNFVNLPIGKFKSKLAKMLNRYGVKLTITEESYTSKASFLDNDTLPTYDAANQEKHTSSGKRIKRGLYKTAKGILLNADINGALNIFRKVDINDVVITQSIFSPRRIFIQK